MRKTTARESIRTVTQVDLDRWDGSIEDALLTTNVATQLDKTAKWVTITIRGRGPDRKIKTLSADMNLGVVRKGKQLFSALLFKILDMLDTANLRVQYNLKLVDWQGVRKRQKDYRLPSSRRQSLERRVLEDVTITIVISR